MADGTLATVPSLADQVSKLYDLVAGYHATNLLEIAGELGAWEALTQSPGLTSEGLAARLGTQSFYRLIGGFSPEPIDNHGVYTPVCS